MSNYKQTNERSTQVPPQLAPYLPVIVFDGECSLCNRLSWWILAHQSGEPAKKMFVVGGESPFGKALLLQLSLEKLAESTILFVTAEQVRTRMDASYAIWRRLRSPWSWLPFAYAWMPRILLNAIYDFISRNRKRQACSIQDTSWRKQYSEFILDDKSFPN